MSSEKWRTYAELVGIVSLVASLVLVAWELNQSNRLARTNAIFDFLAQHNDMHLEVASDPEMAHLLALLQTPDPELSATDLIRVNAYAERSVNISDSITVAYEEGLISRETYELNQKDVYIQLERFPGLKPHITKFVTAYQLPGMELNEMQQAILDAAAQ